MRPWVVAAKPVVGVWNARSVGRAAPPAARVPGTAVFGDHVTPPSAEPTTVPLRRTRYPVSASVNARPSSGSRQPSDEK